jgi:hypothetical protein
VVLKWGLIGAFRIGESFEGLSSAIKENIEIVTAGFSDFIILFEAMLDDIRGWREILVEGSNASFIEKSMLANVSQIIAFISSRAKKSKAQ